MRRHVLSFGVEFTKWLADNELGTDVDIPR